MPKLVRVTTTVVQEWIGADEHFAGPDAAARYKAELDAERLDVGRRHLGDLESDIKSIETAVEVEDAP